MDRIRKYGIIQFKQLRDIIRGMIDRLDIKHTSLQQDVLSLSGGNQQKVVIGKWLSVEPTVLIMDQPTRGIDVGAKEEIYTLVNELAEKGMAILFISDELEEIMNIADRVLVMQQGKIVSEHDNCDRKIAKTTLLGSMIGGKTLSEIN